MAFERKYPFIKNVERPYIKKGYGRLYFILWEIRERYQNKKEEYQAIDRSEIVDLKKKQKELSSLQNVSSGVSKKCMLIYGKAGVGKTHILCHLTSTPNKNFQPYLLYGKQFSLNDNFENRISQLLDFYKGLDGLDEKLRHKNRYAAIIIDAINEGSGLKFWNQILPSIPDIAAKYNYIKFIFSVRCTSAQQLLTNLDGWSLQNIEGFSDWHEATDLYFKKYNINEKALTRSLSDFSNPLFLKTFCVSYNYLSLNQRNSIDRLTLYLIYLRIRNKDITSRVDEDPYRNITEEFLLKLAHYSLFYNYSLSIDRNKARQFADRIVKGRMWSKSLLKAALDENLLMDDSPHDLKAGSIEFEYENLGDYLRAFMFDKVKDG